MKKLINEIHTQESGVIVGKIVNAVIIIAGLAFCIVGIVWQVSKNL